MMIHLDNFCEKIAARIVVASRLFEVPTHVLERFWYLTNVFLHHWAEALCKILFCTSVTTKGLSAARR